MFEGAIIKETLKDELFLDYLQINKAEIWKTNDPDIIAKMIKDKFLL